MISYFFLYAHTLQPDQHGFLSEDVIHSLYENPKYQANLNSQGSPFLLHDDVFGTTLSYDIYEQNVFLCRIILDDIIRPFMPYDGELLLFFSEFVREKYLEMDNSIDTKGSALGIFFTQALDDQISTSTEKLLPLLVPFNWDVTDRYLCLCIHISYKRIGESGTGYYQSVLTRNLPDVYTFSYNDNLIVLVNIDHAYKGDKYQFIKKFATINCNENLRVGFSNTFNQLTDLQYYYRQTFLALTLGLQYSPTIWSHHFRDYRFHLLNDLLSHELPLSCYAPEIEILRNYDIETNNTLLHTLDVYLKNHRNESHTADELFIHRGTLKYRLDKISQLTSINLNDPDELLWLHLILRLSDLEASEKTQV